MDAPHARPTGPMPELQTIEMGYAVPLVAILVRRSQDRRGGNARGQAMTEAWFKEPFFQVALPIIAAFALAHWHQNKRFDDLRSEMKTGFDGLRSEMKAGFDAVNKRIDDLVKRVDRLEDRIGAPR
jgi:hypothetical protein